MLPSFAPRRLALVAAVVLAVALAGCLGVLADDEAEGGADLASSEAAPSSQDDPSDGSLEEPGSADGPSFDDPVLVSDTKGGAEPVVATTADGTIFLEGLSPNNNLFRSADGGASWTDVTPPGAGREIALDGFVAAGNDGTVYHANAFSGTLRIFRSADAGETWIPTAPPPVSEPMHRMWIVPEGESTVHVVAEYLPLEGDGQVWYMRSMDRGTTWSHVALLDNRTHFGSDLAVGPDGAIYNVRLDDDYSGEAKEIPPEEPDARASRPRDDGGGDGACLAAEGSGWYLRASRDGGETWERHPMFGSGGAGCSALASSWQSLEVDADGNLYFLWSWQRGDTSLVHYSVSADGGETWTDPTPIAPDLGAQALPWSHARSPGHLDVTWYGAPVQGDTEALDTSWHGYHARVAGATDPANATTTVTRVTDQPLHEGNICTKGPACDQGEDRSLLDYTWVDVGPDDRAHLAFASTTLGNDRANPVYVGQAAAGSGS